MLVLTAENLAARKMGMCVSRSSTRVQCYGSSPCIWGHISLLLIRGIIDQRPGHASDSPELNYSVYNSSRHWLPTPDDGPASKLCMSPGKASASLTEA